MNRIHFRTILFLISFVLLVSLACIGTKSADPTATAPPQAQVEVVEEPPVEEVVVEQDVPEEVVEEVVLPTPTSPPVRQVPPTATEAPVEEVVEEPPMEEQAAESQPFFIEEFEGDLSNWSYFLMSGEENDMDLYADYGRLIFDLNGVDQWVYFMYDEYIYSDVRIDVYAENMGKNTNSVSLICNYSDRFGWYEFNISNGGLYDILVYSELDNSYFTLASGGSNNVKMGRDVNIYTAICQGNTLELYINGVFEREFVDSKYNLREGLVGLSVSSFNVLPIIVEVDYFAISQP